MVLVTGTMLLIAIRQLNWIEVGSMAAELAEKNSDKVMKAVKKAAENAAENDRTAQILLSLWAQIKWLEINEE